MSIVHGPHSSSSSSPYYYNRYILAPSPPLSIRSKGTRTPRPTISPTPVSPASTVTGTRSLAAPPVVQNQILQLPEAITRIELFLKHATNTISQAPELPMTLHLPGIPHSILEDLQTYIYDVAALDCHLSVAKHIKLSYSGDTQTLIISYAGRAHEITTRFSQRILELITANDNAFFGAHKDDPDFRIDWLGQADVKYTSATGKKSIRQPDGSLGFHDEVPFLVLEVADTQRHKDVMGRVEDYLIGTEGDVRIVIIVELVRRKPPKKRKRRIEEGDREDAVSEVEEVDGEPVGESDAAQQTRYSRGLFWVYTYTRPPAEDPTAYAAIKCLHEAEEFYPTPPESSLELSWADILNPDEIPPDLVDKTVKIPFLILHELFTPVVEDRPRAVWKKKARMKFVRGRGYPGKVVSSDVEEPGSEVSLPDLEGSDATYVGGVGGLEVECGGVVTRSMARGE